MPRFPIITLAATSVLAAAALTACGQTPAADDRLSIVASTDVYGDIAARIGGEDVAVTSIITSAAQDPHSYEASAQDQLAIADADLVIENGGGYDPFIDTLVDASGNADVEVLSAVEVSGLAPDDDATDDDAETEEADEHEDGDGHEDDGHDHIEGFNEHVWYSFEAMDALAREIAGELGDLDPANAATYVANYEEFATGLETLESRAHELHEQFDGTGVAVTEPVPLYLLAELGLDDRTPADFSEAIEEGTDVPPLVLDETLRLIESGEVALLAYNEQTAGSETDEVRATAEAAGIPVVSFTETLPDGADYLSWMTDNLEAVVAALS